MSYRKNIPRRDGSGRGVRYNTGRGGCSTPRALGQGFFDTLQIIKDYVKSFSSKIISLKLIETHQVVIQPSNVVIDFAFKINA